MYQEEKRLGDEMRTNRSLFLFGFWCFLFFCFIAETPFSELVSRSWEIQLQ